MDGLCDDMLKKAVSEEITGEINGGKILRQSLIMTMNTNINIFLINNKKYYISISDFDFDKHMTFPQ